jgi:Zn-dependent peptidase ImmA (M78 family)
MHFLQKLINIVFIAILICVPLLAEAREHYQTDQKNVIELIQERIYDHAQRLGIPKEAIKTNLTKNGDLEVTINHQGKQQKETFTKNELKKSTKDKISHQSKKHINKMFHKVFPGGNDHPS